MAEAAPSPMSVEEFFAWQERQGELYELIDGRPAPRAMTGATRRHDRVVVRAIAAFGSKLRGGPCEPHTADVAIRTGRSRVRRPDLTVDCGPFDPASLTADNPVLIIEVLSPATSNIDRFIKVEEYKSLPTLRYILIADPANPVVILYARGAEGAWTSMTHIGLDSELDLAAIGCSLTLADLYDAPPDGAGQLQA